MLWLVVPSSCHWETHTSCWTEVKMPHIPRTPGGVRVHCPSSLSPLSGHLGGFSQVDKSLLNVIMKPLGKLAGNRSDIGNVGVKVVWSACQRHREVVGVSADLFYIYMELIPSQHCGCIIVTLTISRSLNMTHVHEDDMMVVRMACLVIIMMYFGTNAHMYMRSASSTCQSPQI